MASDQDRFDTAYEAFRDLVEGLYNIGGTPRVSPARMRRVSSYRMDRRSCKSWCICLGLGHERD